MSKEIKFEQALDRLDEIVRKLESGETTLDQSMKLFEEGIALSGACSDMLKNAKQKVEMLIDNGGKLETKVEILYGEADDLKVNHL